MNHWYDWVFWIFFGAGLLFILGIIIKLIVEAIRNRPKPFVKTYGPETTYTSPYDSDTTWGVGGTDSSTGFDTSSPSSDSGGSDSSSDSGGGFEGGGGESGGGGSSGSWND